MGWLHVVFRVVYDSLYFFLSVILLLLLCVTPADSIRQALANKQRFHILIIIVCLSVTLAFVVFVYFVRLYINRTALANIPKSYIPIGKGEAKRSVRKMIAASLSRSAAIAYDSRPRAVPARPPTATTDHTGEDAVKKRRKSVLRLIGLSRTKTAEDKTGNTLPPHKAVWGEIEHYGWASPNSPDLPNLQYSTVISELPDLIEAKAMTLAPPLPESTNDRPALDPEAIALLQRPGNLSVRQYLAQLTELGVLEASRATADFLTAYEYARYSTRPISNERFRELMHLFAEILRTMQPLDPAVLIGLGDDDDASPTESDIDDDAPRRSPSTPRSQVSKYSFSLHRQQSTASHATTTTSGSGNSGHSGRSSQSVRRGPQRRIMGRNRNSSQGTWGAATFRTAPTTPKSRRAPASPTSSLNSFAQTRPSYSLGRGASTSTSSLGVRSVASSGGGSVIRLSERGDATTLPYVLSLAETHQVL